MPAIGDIKRSDELGYESRRKRVWAACIYCGAMRWVYTAKNGEPSESTCRHCVNRAGELNARWSGGRVNHFSGYIWVMVFPNDFFYPMANKQGYVLEHRLVMAKHLGRCILLSEVVHHINGIKDDNRRDDLRLYGSSGEHQKYHHACRRAQLKGNGG